MTAQYILYTYATANGQGVCHAYGPTSQENAQLTGENLQAGTPTLGFMVLPLEAVPV